METKGLILLSIHINCLYHDLSDSVFVKAELAGSTNTQVDDAPFDKRAPIINPDNNGTAIF